MLVCKIQLCGMVLLCSSAAELVHTTHQLCSDSNAACTALKVSAAAA